MGPGGAYELAKASRQFFGGADLAMKFAVTGLVRPSHGQSPSASRGWLSLAISTSVIPSCKLAKYLS
jgi:hypothetical protein